MPVWLQIAVGVLTSLSLVIGILIALRNELRKWMQGIVAAATDDIRTELRTNGGSSLRDAVNRIEHTQAVTDKRLNQALDRLDAMERDPSARTRSTDRMGA